MRSHLEQALQDVGMKVYNRLGKEATDNLNEEELLDAAKEIAVERQNKLIARLKLAKVKQGEGESVTAFSFKTRLRPVAKSGKLRKT